MRQLVPSVLRWGAPGAIVSMSLDEQRHLLYAHTDKSAIQVRPSATVLLIVHSNYVILQISSFAMGENNLKTSLHVLHVEIPSNCNLPLCSATLKTPISAIKQRTLEWVL